VNDPIDTRPNTRGPANLKPADIGYFEPKAMPDSDPAINFIESFTDAVIHYGEANTLAVLRKCCHNDIARAWVASLKDADRTAIARSTWHWEFVLRRDFMPRPAQLYAAARGEQFKWTQGRSPLVYVAHKIRLLKTAGITEDDHVLQEVHDGFVRCPEIQIPLEAYVLETGNDISEYRRVVQRYQESTKMQYEYHRRSNTSSHREKLPPKAITAGADKEQAANPSYPRNDSKRKDRHQVVRKRKCKNFPSCGDGEHFDWECKIRNNQTQLKRAYYISPESDNEVTYNVASEEGVEMRDPDSGLENENEHQQNAHFASVWRAERGFMGTEISPKNTASRSSPPKRIPPKPSECRKCRMAFPWRNQLHHHVLATGHNTQAARDVIESTLHTRDGADLNILASFHYAKAEFMLSERDLQLWISCVDSGYGNSAVDKLFLETRVEQPIIRDLELPVLVRGIGGAKVACTQVAIFPIYYPTMDGRLAKITRPYHIFANLGCELLIRIDTIYLERIDLFFSSAVPQIRLGNCEASGVKISVFRKQLVKKIPVRAAKRTVVPANSTTVMPIKIGRNLPQDQDYIFTPSKLKTISAIGVGAPHGIFSHNQQTILFTNVNNTDVTIFHNTILGHVESIQKAHHADWDEATEDVNAFFGHQLEAKISTLGAGVDTTTPVPGCTPAEEPCPAPNEVHAYSGQTIENRAPEAERTSKTFDPETDAEMPLPQEAPGFSTETRLRPNVSTAPCPDMGAKCAEEIWVRPMWLDETYQPQYAFELPDGIIVPTIDTTTYQLVVVNEEDDISPEQVDAVRDLIARHPHLFNDGMDCVREPVEDWLRLPVDKEYELKLQAGRPYKVSKQGERAIDESFDALRTHG
jgi:hypothetical protein